MPVTIEQATVFKSGRRRYFTKASAYRAEAWGLISKKYPCLCEAEIPEDNYPGMVCDTHDGNDHYKKLAARLAGFLMKNSRKKP